LIFKGNPPQKLRSVRADALPSRPSIVAGGDEPDVMGIHVQAKPHPQPGIRQQPGESVISVSTSSESPAASEGGILSASSQFSAVARYACIICFLCPSNLFSRCPHVSLLFFFSASALNSNAALAADGPGTKHVKGGPRAQALVKDSSRLNFEVDAGSVSFCTPAEFDPKTSAQVKLFNRSGTYVAGLLSSV